MLNAEKILRQQLAELGDFLVDVLRKELKMQGHRLTGKLEKSIEAVVKHKSDEWLIDIMHERYGTYQDTGVSANRIPYTPGSGARTSKYISALIRWVQLRGIAPGFARAKGIAFAIAKTHKKEGMPTKGSYRFSNNGRRTLWLQHPASAQEKTIERRIGDAYEASLDAQLDALIINLADQTDGLTKIR